MENDTQNFKNLIAEGFKVVFIAAGVFVQQLSEMCRRDCIFKVNSISSKRIRVNLITGHFHKRMVLGNNFFIRYN